MLPRGPRGFLDPKTAEIPSSAMRPPGLWHKGRTRELGLQVAAAASTCGLAWGGRRPDTLQGLGEDDGTGSPQGKEGNHQGPLASRVISYLIRFLSLLLLTFFQVVVFQLWLTNLLTIQTRSKCKNPDSELSRDKRGPSRTVTASGNPSPQAGADGLPTQQSSAHLLLWRERPQSHYQMLSAEERSDPEPLACLPPSPGHDAV